MILLGLVLSKACTKRKSQYVVDYTAKNRLLFSIEDQLPIIRKDRLQDIKGRKLQASKEEQLTLINYNTLQTRISKKKIIFIRNNRILFIFSIKQSQGNWKYKQLLSLDKLKPNRFLNIE
jgi:hypothetical protein